MIAVTLFEDSTHTDFSSDNLALMHLFTSLRVTIYSCAPTIGYSSYGPPPTWQRGSRIVIAQAGYDGVNQTWVRQEDGSRMDDSECIKIAPQAACSD